MQPEIIPAQTYPFQFTGTTREYFRIWIVNVLLTVVTIGIYSAWAKVRNKRYFYGNTLVDGSAFDYTADPKKILVGRLIAVGLLVVYQVSVGFSLALAGWLLLFGMFLIPAIVVMSMTFRMRYSSWRGIHFGFQRDFPTAYLLFSPLLAYVGLLALTNILYGDLLQGKVQSDDVVELMDMEQKYFQLQSIIGYVFLFFMALFPWWQSRYYRFVANRISYGQSRFQLELRAGDFYLIYLASLAIFALFSFAVYLLITIVGIDPVEVIAGADSGSMLGAFAVFACLVLIFSLVQVTLAAFIKTHVTNLVYGQLVLGDVSLKSELKFQRMWYLYVTNTLGIIFSLGMAIPWAKIRTMQYRADTMTAYAGELDQFVASSEPEADAKADAITDLFDFDLGL